MSASGINSGIHSASTARNQTSSVEQADRRPTALHGGLSDFVGASNPRSSDSPAAGRNADVPPIQRLSVVGLLHWAFGISGGEPEPRDLGSSHTYSPNGSAPPPPPPPHLGASGFPSTYPPHNLTTPQLPPTAPDWTEEAWPDFADHPAAPAEAPAAPLTFDQNPVLAPVAAMPTMEMTAAMKALEMTRKSLHEVQSANISIDHADGLIPRLVNTLQRLRIGSIDGLNIDGKYLYNRENCKYENTPENVTTLTKINEIKANVKILKSKLEIYPAEADLKKQIALLQQLVACHTEDAIKQFGID
jgi:hypothetical protein